jgi:hypothetical protein
MLPRGNPNFSRIESLFKIEITSTKAFPTPRTAGNLLFVIFNGMNVCWAKKRIKSKKVIKYIYHF